MRSAQPATPRAVNPCSPKIAPSTRTIRTADTEPGIE